MRELRRRKTPKCLQFAGLVYTEINHFISLISVEGIHFVVVKSNFFVKVRVIFMFMAILLSILNGN